MTESQTPASPLAAAPQPRDGGQSRRIDVFTGLRERLDPDRAEFEAKLATDTRCRFRPGMPAFIERWSEAGATHHFAPGTGRQIGALTKVARLPGVDTEVVAE